MKLFAILYTILSLILLTKQNKIKTNKSESTLQERIQRQNIVSSLFIIFTNYKINRMNMTQLCKRN